MSANPIMRYFETGHLPERTENGIAKAGPPMQLPPDMDVLCGVCGQPCQLDPGPE